MNPNYYRLTKATGLIGPNFRRNCLLHDIRGRKLTETAGHIRIGIQLIVDLKYKKIYGTLKEVANDSCRWRKKFAAQVK